MEHYLKRKILILLLIILSTEYGRSQTVDSWITTPDQSKKLESQSVVNFSTDDGSGGNIIDINLENTYQELEGFGFALTQGSAQALMELNTTLRNELLSELFHPEYDGQSVVRISIGASDLSNSVYTYNETAGDVNMDNFAISSPDQTYLIPILLDILEINPNIKIIATPWTAPTWMKSNETWIGGSLEPEFYSAYALYFIKYLDTMASLGINIWAITPQNEPENPFNEPSMEMTASEQLTFINDHLGPALSNSPYNTKIIAFDHNCNNTNYPIQVLNNSTFVDGAAFHLYDGDISAMSTVKNQTGKNVYFTEQFTSTEGNFGGDLSWHLRNVVIGSTRNWSKTVIEWNLATDSNYGPKTPGGCSDCLGAITVTGENSYEKNVSYYILSHISRFVQPGAVRIGTNTNDIQNVAFLNPDNTIALVAFNNGNKPNTDFKVRVGDQSFAYTLPKGAAATFRWSIDESEENFPPSVSIVSPENGTSYENPESLTIEAEASDADGTISQVNFYANGSLIGEDNSAPYSITWSEINTESYNLVAEAVDNEGARNTSTEVTINITSGNSEEFEMYVEDVIVGTQGGGNKRGTASVTIINDEGQLLSGVNVIGTFSGSFNETVNGTTGPGGEVSFTTSSKTRGEVSFEFCVDDVNYVDFSYNPNLNIITCNSFGENFTLNQKEKGQNLNSKNRIDKIYFYPNPVQNGQLYFKFGTDKLKIVLLDISGKKIMDTYIKNPQEPLTIPDNIKPGLYYLKTTSGQQTQNHRLVID